MLPQFQLNCINAQDDCLIYLTEAIGLSIHQTSDEQFNPNHVIHLASYSSLGNFMDESNTDLFLNIVEIFQLRLFSNFKKLSRCLQVKSQENFRLSNMFLKLK